MNTSKQVVSSVALAAVLSAAFLAGRNSGKGAEKAGSTAVASESSLPRQTASRRAGVPSPRDPSVSSARSVDLTGIRSVMEAADPAIHSRRLADYLRDFDASKGLAVMEYVASLGGDYAMDRFMIMGEWAKRDPAAAMAWAEKSSPSLIQMVLGAWAAKDPEAAIFWADKQYPSSVEGSPYYAHIIKNLPKGDDQIELATRLMMAVPKGSFAIEVTDAATSLVRRQGLEKTYAWLKELPVDRQGDGARVLPLFFIDQPAQTLTSLKDSGVWSPQGRQPTRW